MFEEIDDMEFDFDGEDTILIYKKKYFEVLSEFLDTVDYSVLG